MITLCWHELFLGSVSEVFTKDEQRKFLNGTVYNISVDHSLIRKEDILNIYKFLMVKNNIKWCLGL